MTNTTEPNATEPTDQPNTQEPSVIATIGKYQLINRSEADLLKMQEIANQEPLIFWLFRKMTFLGTILAMLTLSLQFLARADLLPSSRLSRILFFVFLGVLVKHSGVFFEIFKLVDVKNPNAHDVFKASAFHWWYVFLTSVLSGLWLYFMYFKDMSFSEPTMSVLTAVMLVAGLLYFPFNLRNMLLR